MKFEQILSFLAKKYSTTVLKHGAIFLKNTFLINFYSEKIYIYFIYFNIYIIFKNNQ